MREDADAWPEGFVTAYAMSEAREDFVENIAMYVTHDQAYWDNMLKVAGTAGAAIINQKFTIVYNYMLETWGINLDDLRAVSYTHLQSRTYPVRLVLLLKFVYVVLLPFMVAPNHYGWWMELLWKMLLMWDLMIYLQVMLKL